MNNDQDMQKRTMLFFVAVSILMIGFAMFSSYFFPSKEQKQQTQQEITQTKNTQTTKVENQATKTTTEKTTQTEKKIQPKYLSTGSFDLLLNQQRISADDLKDTVVIDVPYGKIQFSKIGGRIISIYLNKYNVDVIGKYSKENKIFPTEIITTNPKLTKLINFSKYNFKQDGRKLTFKLEKDGILVVKTFILNDTGEFTLNIQTKGLENVGIALIDGISFGEEGSYGHAGAIIKTDKDLIEIDSDIEQEEIIRGKILWSGVENKYFMQIFANHKPLSIVHVVPVAENKTVTFVEIPTNIDGFFFGSAKLYSSLGEITKKYQKEWGVNLALRETINFGIFGILGKPLFIILHFIYDYVHNWGLAIIILTILLRLVLFPLNHKSLKAMKKMADLAPEIEKIRKQYAKDPQKMQAEIMKLYSEAGANPMSGCLPMVAQIPIFIALYNVLMVSVELKNAPFMLWIHDLSDKDPYYILPILMGLSMIAQQWITPSSDKNQKMIMYVMAGVFTFLFMNFPAGLVLYWLTNNILGIIQSFIINKQMGRYKAKK